MDWLKIAKNLPLSHKARSECHCGSGNPRVINHQHEGYSYLCFRCGDKGFVGKGKQTLEELEHIRKLNEQAANTVLKIELPNDFTTDIPIEGRLWLYKGGITESVWKEYNFGWSEYMQRVVMPVYDQNNKLIWFQARAVLNGQKPKYLNPTGDRSSLIFWSKPLSGDMEQTRSVVVVEDILSTVRTGSVTRSCSLLGTKITVQQARQLANFKCVKTWLDPDEAGIQGAYKVRKLLGMVTEVRDIRSDQDPKCYSNEEIRRILHEA